jgi:hypothetical protein
MLWKIILWCLTMTVHKDGKVFCLCVCFGKCAVCCSNCWKFTFTHTQVHIAVSQNCGVTVFFVNFSDFAYTVFVATYGNYCNYFGVLYMFRLTSSHPQPSKWSALAHHLPTKQCYMACGKVICGGGQLKMLKYYILKIMSLQVYIYCLFT